MAEAVDCCYDNFKDFDRECFLIGALDDNNGHYQTFTANKSKEEIDGKVKWLFRKSLKFMMDTVRCQRITTFGHNCELTLFITAMFKDDYPDLRALYVCFVYPFMRYYGNEIKVATYIKDCEIELFSLSLAKTVAGYYNFGYDSVAAVSSGGDIGYRGVINSEKIATDAQKMSFLAGVFMRYCNWYNRDYNEQNDNRNYSITIPNSLSTAKKCVDILKEFGCDNVKEIQTEHKIIFNASNRIKELIFLTYDLRFKMGVTLVN
jgi:hypothetical protein